VSETADPRSQLDIRLRAEVQRDDEAIHQIVRAAFNDDATAELVARIRQSPHYIPELSLVAEHAGDVVGHIMLHHLNLRDGATTHEVVSLSPVSVRPDVQRRGMGSALIRDATERADQRGEPLIVLEGSPAYYPRFGFRPAREFGITISLPSWAPEEAAMVYPLSRYRPEIKGHVVYPPAFDRVNADREQSL
jgi:putative acetyltransferase